MIDLVTTIGTRLPRAAAPFFPDLLWRGPADGRTAYLTFDDGPSPELTLRLAEVLERFDARATFFLVGAHVERHPDLVRSLVDGGHEIGGHTYSHPDPWRTPADVVREELERTTRTLEEVTQRPVRFMRPPYGHFTRAMRRWSSENGQRLVMWDLGPGDYLEWVSQDHVERHIRSFIRPGSVIVLHDNPRAANTTVPVLARVLKSLSAEGWRFESLSASHVAGIESRSA